MKLLKQNIEISVLFWIGFILRLYYAHLDPYLHEWDERYHALVARNMVDNPFVPLLYKKPLVPYDLNAWCCNSVWLHKQPLFMWQMALSMKIFGANEFTLRVPSALMGAITILLVYRIAILLTNNKTTAIIAGLLICFSQYQLELISGQIGMDHNDVAFDFYILASFWAFAEKLKNEKLLWNILIGVFAGCAILNKWLVGLLVFLPYGLLVFKQLIIQKKAVQIKYFSISLICCIVVFLPWQIYILHSFKALALFEYNYSSQHIFKVMEGHAGTIFHYFNNFDKYFGKYIWLFIFVGTVMAWIKSKQFDMLLHWSLFVSFIAVFVFFSFIVQSKLYTYFFIAVPFGIIYMAIGVQQLLDIINIKWIKYLIVIVVTLITFNPNKSIERRKQNASREKLIHNTQIYKRLHQILPPYVKNIINTNLYEGIDVMFYNNDITAYHYWIDVKQLDSLKSKKIWIGVFKTHGAYYLPAEYSNYPYLYEIDELLE